MKECKYCHKNAEKRKAIWTSNDFDMYIDFDDNGLRISYESEYDKGYTHLYIYNCPMCGRKLDDNNE